MVAVSDGSYGYEWLIRHPFFVPCEDVTFLHHFVLANNLDLIVGGTAPSSLCPPLLCVRSPWCRPT